MRDHDPVACLLCEPVPAEGYRRHWKHEPNRGTWHVIADEPDLIARLPRQAYFVTILSYRPDREGSPAQYRGPLYFEFDATHPAQTFDELRRCMALLESEYGCPLEAIHIWHSGGRGFHVTIPPVIIGADDGHAQLPHIYAAMIERLFPPHMACTLDRGIYNMGKGRMWRLPNRRRSDTGRYKVPLAMREVLHKPYDEAEALTLRPRQGRFWPSEDELSPCPGLVQVYQEAVAVVERETSLPRGARAGRELREGASEGKGLLFHLFQSRGWLGDEIAPDKVAVACPWESTHTKGEPFDTSTVLFLPHEGDSLGWFYCSHAHCHERTLSDVLRIFSPAERTRAREQAGLPMRVRTISAALIPMWRTMPTSEVQQWR